MKRSKRIPALICLSALLWLGLAPIVSAVPPKPASFWGNVLVNGANVAPGTPISAWINGVKHEEDPSFLYQGTSVYVLYVEGDDPDTVVREGGLPGETIRFKIGDYWADQTSIWQESGGGVLDLSTGAAPVYWSRYLPVIVKNHPAPPQPTATPTRTPTATPTRTPTTAPSATTIPSQITIDRIEDTYIRVDMNETYNSEDPGRLKIKTSQESMRPLIRFDLGEIPQNAIIDSALLTLHTNLFPFAPPAWPMNVRCHMLRRPWSEVEATWYVASTGTPWAVPGADDLTLDREASFVTSTTISERDTPYTFNITTAVQRWVSGASPNYGLILIGDGNISEYRFHSRSGQAGKTPILDISLRIP